MPSAIRCDSEDGILTVHVTEAKILDAMCIEQMHQELVGILGRAEELNVLIDFRTVKFMSSAALGMLVRINKKCREAKKNLKLSGIAPDIRQVFKITALEKAFDIQDTAAAAYEAFAKQKSRA